MKRTLLVGIVTLGVSAVASYGQGYIALDNYSSGNNTVPITYGANVPANGVSGALGSGPLSSAWTVGLYWVSGATGLVDPAGTGLPNASLALGTGAGSTVAIDTQNAVGNAGFYGSIPSWNAGSSTITAITLEIVVYPTAAGSYAAAAYRIHSAAFSMPTSPITNPTPNETGDYCPGPLAVLPTVPEPATMALGGLGIAAMMLIRRKKA